MRPGMSSDLFKCRVRFLISRITTTRYDESPAQVFTLRVWRHLRGHPRVSDLPVSDVNPAEIDELKVTFMHRNRTSGTVRRQGLVYLDGSRIDLLMRRRQISITRLAVVTEVSTNSLRKAIRGDGILAATATAIANGLGLPDFSPLKDETDLHELQERDFGPRSGEWSLDRCLGEWATTSNGLQFRVCRMTHAVIDGRRGRGKWYDLLHLSQSERADLKHHLVRHPSVSDRIGPHPNISENLTTLPEPGGREWWVVDRWVEGGNLEDALLTDDFDRQQLPGLMSDIATGLQALHHAGFAFRELSPRRITIAASDGRAVLTDFELAKLLEPGPSVSADWKDDPFRAPEVEAGTADARSDLYSWALILVHAATRLPPEECSEFAAVMEAGLPKAVWGMARDCLSPDPDDRPKSIAAVLKTIRRWTISH